MLKIPKNIKRFTYSDPRSLVITNLKPVKMKGKKGKYEFLVKKVRRPQYRETKYETMVFRNGIYRGSDTIETNNKENLIKKLKIIKNKLDK